MPENIEVIYDKNKVEIKNAKQLTQLAQDNIKFTTQGQILTNATIKRATNKNLKDKTALLVYDVNDKQKFYNQLEGALKGDKQNKNYANLKNNFNKLIVGSERFSITPIHTEMYMHILRITRVLTENYDKNKRDSIKNNLQQLVFNQIYKLLNHDLAAYLNSKDKITVQQLNEYLDTLREPYAILIESMVASYSKLFDVDYPSHNQMKKSLKDKTAEDIDIISTNQLLSQLTLITAPENGNSSHSKKRAKPALMLMQRFKKDKKDEHSYQLIQTQGRVPSLTTPTLKDGTKLSIEEQLEKIFDYYAKFIDFNKQCSVVYNLFTSLPRGFDSCNQQASAKEIFKGLHRYNKRQLDKPESERKNRPFCYAFNLAVNQHTKKLEYTSSTDEVKEALIFADIALFTSMERLGFLPQKCKNNLKFIEHHYQKFLNNKNENKGLFCQSSYFNQTKTTVVAIKDYILNNDINENRNKGKGKQNQIASALLKLYSAKFHGHDPSKMKGQKKFASIIQAMQLSIDQFNLKGCKSANERFLKIENMNELMLAYANSTNIIYSEKNKNGGTINVDISAKINQCFEAFKKNNNGSKFTFGLLKIVDQYITRGSGSLVAILDCGSDKSKSSKKSLSNLPNKQLDVGGINTNYHAALISTKTECQKHAVDVQSHKGTKKRLPIITNLTDKCFKKYSNKSDDNKIELTQKTLLELCMKVLKEYTSSWGLRHHFRKEAKKAHTAIGEMRSDDVDVVNKLENLIFRLTSEMKNSGKYTKNSTYNAKLIFISTKVQEYKQQQQLN